MKYVPLRVYSVFSRGKGAVDARVLGEFLSQRGVPALAVTDPFMMAGWECFREEAVKYNLKPLLGIEIRLRNIGALVLYPISVKGYFSLVSSYNRKVFSAMEDVIAVCVLNRGVSRLPSCSSSIADIRKQVAPGNFYLGLEWNSGREVTGLAAQHGVPLVWMQPWKWVVNPEKYAVASAVFNHHPVSDLLTGTKSSELPLFGPMSAFAVQRRWADAGKEAMKNTFALVSRVQFDFTDITGQGSQKETEGNNGGNGGNGSNSKNGKNGKNDDNGVGEGIRRLMPASVAPSDSWDPGNQLEEVVNREMSSRDLTVAERERAFRELNIIKEQGFSVYFLIASEIGSYCKRNQIYFNLRGSGVSSFILYLLGLSRSNPLHYDLLFERFVNSLRDDLPDIDIDIDSSRRHEVLKWVFERYEKRVIFVSTHKFFKARSALYEVARAYGFSAEDSHKMTKELRMFASPETLKGQGKGRMAQVYDMAALLEGVFKEFSLHLGGVLFSGKPVEEAFPMEISPHGFQQVIWDKYTVERLRIFKLDLLGVRGFDVISPVALKGGVDFEDADVWKNIREARTIGCFQQESPLVRDTLRQVLPTDLHELAVTIAIIRPGPAQSGMKQAYIEKRQPLHPVLAKIFPRTRGTLIFEEQISVLLHTVAGWNLERAEKVRRDLKKGKGMVHREEFFRKGKINGWKEEDLREFWQLAGDFARYAFNQGHSVSYAYSAYLSSWYKTKQPVSFFCRLFNSGGGYYPLPFYIDEAVKWGITLLPPDINFSSIGFSEEEGAIRTGFIFVKGVGGTLASKIVKKRGFGYTGLEDFINRLNVGERDLAALMAVSAFRSLGQNGFTPKEREENWKRYLGFVPRPGDGKEKVS